MVIVDAKNCIMHKIRKSMEKAKYSCFAKVSVSKVSVEEKQVEELQREKMSQVLEGKVKEKVKDVDEKLAAALHNLNI